MQTMFHSAAVKLTLWYLSIIMVLSVGMSLALYHVSSDQLDRNTGFQVGYFNNFLSPGDQGNFLSLRQQQLESNSQRLKDNLLLFNLVVLGLGGAASYALARRTLRPIEESHDAQERFAADASHELRTPLTVMQSETEVALRDPTLTKTSAIKQLKSNLEEVAKLRTLSDNLLKLSAPASPSTEIVELKQAVREATGQARKAAAAKNVKISTRLSGASVKGDYASLVQLISILLDNAVKYSPSGKEVKVSLEKQPAYAVASISDTGPGITPTDLPRIFERFYRTDASRSKSHTNGYGLGLALAKKIAENHQASVEVESTPGRGSTFRLRLPLA